MKTEVERGVLMPLNVNEVLVATYVGSRRNAEAHYHERKLRFPEKNPGETWGFHINSAHAELAVSKYLGVYWGFGVNTFCAPDIENTDIEVRWSSRNDMKVKPNDKGIVVSVTGRCPTYRIVGWMFAENAKQDEWFCRQDPVCWFVPHKALLDIAELKTAIKLGF